MEEYVSPEPISKVLRGIKPEITPPEVKHFQFVVILADDMYPQKAPAIISAVMGTLVEHRANVSTVTPVLFVALLGVPFPEGNSAEARRGLVDALLRENGDLIRIVHGESDGAFGMFGGHGRWTYGALLPGLAGILGKLVGAKFGTAVEVESKTPNAA
ncbi:MAG TPA: hypothetical protein VN902_06880 [Candidatus Acidoferrales bacterium]|jgi:hypothetical protein|nr:hypothetical protein [Candidatus Acidoferrales bacterium]